MESRESTDKHVWFHSISNTDRNFRTRRDPGGWTLAEVQSTSWQRLVHVGDTKTNGWWHPSGIMVSMVKNVGHRPQTAELFRFGHIEKKNRSMNLDKEVPHSASSLKCAVYGNHPRLLALFQDISGWNIESLEHHHLSLLDSEVPAPIFSIVVLE